jgi:hypothetical protein
MFSLNIQLPDFIAVLLQPGNRQVYGDGILFMKFTEDFTGKAFRAFPLFRFFRGNGQFGFPFVHPQYRRFACVDTAVTAAAGASGMLEMDLSGEGLESIGAFGDDRIADGFHFMGGMMVFIDQFLHAVGTKLRKVIPAITLYLGGDVFQILFQDLDGFFFVVPPEADNAGNGQVFLMKGFDQTPC